MKQLNKNGITCYDVDVALEREVEGDLLLSDIGQVSIIILLQFAIVYVKTTSFNISFK